MAIQPRRSLLNTALKRPSALSSKPRRPELLWLDKNENLDPELLATAQSVLAALDPLALATYPEAGYLYRKLSMWTGVSPESLLLTPGSDGVIRLTYEAFIEHGDSVVHTSPTFAMYPVYAQMFGAEAVAVEYARTADGPYLDPDRLHSALSQHRPKLLCLPNPDSPTGTVMAPSQLRDLLAACESAGTVLLVDEAYHPFHEWSAVPWTQISPNLIVARTFAKAWGAAGMRIGYAVAHPETIGLLHKMRPMYEVGTVAIEFMTRMIDHVDAMEQSVVRINEAKRRFSAQMEALGFGVLPTAGNFIHVAFGGRGPAVHAALAGRVLYRAAFDSPCLAGYSRFSVAPSPTMAEVADIIRQSTEGAQ